MAADDSTELLPVMGGGEPSFDTAMRGYDKRQVDDYVSRLEADLLDAMSARDLALSVSAERAAQLAGVGAQIESLEQLLAHARSSQTIDVNNVDALVAGKLVAARDDAEAIKAAAQAQAEQIRLDAVAAADIAREQATAEGARVIEAARADADRDRLTAAGEIEVATAAAAQRTAEAEQRMAQARMQAVAELDSARAEAESLLATATAERDRLDADSLATRQHVERTSEERRLRADEDFEITLRARRTAAAEQAEAELAATRETVAQMIAEAEERVNVLTARRAQLHSELLDLQSRLATVIAETAP
jgi:DivIVA domain-containing protein